jgi:hypothetical protein
MEQKCGTRSGLEALVAELGAGVALGQVGGVDGEIVRDERLNAIEAILLEADAGPAFDALLAELRATVNPNLSRPPRIGRRHLETHRSRPRCWPSPRRCQLARRTSCARSRRHDRNHPPDRDPRRRPPG